MSRIVLVAETAEFASRLTDAFGEIKSTSIEDALYLASPGEILEQLAGVADDCDTAIVVGHNPGLESLCHLLAGPGSERAAVNDLRRGFPTAALAVFELNGNSWPKLGSDGARLVDFVRPRDLE